MAKDAYYFSHDSNARNDPKIGAMISVYGMEGYGWYWVIVEMMREQENYRLRISGKYDYNALALQMHCTPEKAAQFIHDCIYEFTGEKDEGLFQTDGDFIWSNSLLRRMKKKDERSAKAKRAAKARWNKDSDDDTDNKKCSSNANAMQTQCSDDAIKGKERKGKEKKDNTTVGGGDPLVNILRENIRLDIRKDEVEKISAWLDDGIELDVIEWAAKEARMSGTRNINYLNGILRNLHTEGVLTMDGVQAREERFKRRKNKESPSDDDAIGTAREKPFDFEEYKRRQLEFVEKQKKLAAEEKGRASP